MAIYEVERVYFADGWACPGWLEIDRGFIAAVHRARPPGAVTRIAGYGVPGMPNVHSHGFQRALAGLAERGGSDSFWSWRDGMYGLVERLEPADVEAVTAQVYVEMLEAGYTSVGEFHYLHNDRQGRPYANPAELSECIVRASRTTGIGLTLLPVLYMHGGFGGVPPAPAQRRFVSDIPWFVALIEALVRACSGDPQICIGVAPHSLRAVTPQALGELLQAVERVSAGAPIHIHAAEQLREVEECVAWSGLRPVDWLLENSALDARFAVIHATHMTDAEARGLARSGATVGLCPSTEANLGDGLFELRRFVDAGGHVAVGSDSNVTVSPIEELRWLEYGQRLSELRRLVAADDVSPSCGERLWGLAMAGGARALGRSIAGLVAGQRADLVVLDPDHPALAERSAEALFDALVFAGSSTAVRDVMVGGEWRVREGRHLERAAVLERYRASLVRLRA